MILVRHAMSSDLKTAKPDMTAADASGLMRSYDVGSSRSSMTTERSSAS
jgi:hypothetical protein